MFVLFLQAEDGIRDLVRSRGLGDVYKRQVVGWLETSPERVQVREECREAFRSLADSWIALTAVSYTHLTLPTSDLV